MVSNMTEDQKHTVKNKSISATIVFQLFVHIIVMCIIENFPLDLNLKRGIGSVFVLIA